MMKILKKSDYEELLEYKRCYLQLVDNIEKNDITLLLFQKHISILETKGVNVDKCKIFLSPYHHKKFIGILFDTYRHVTKPFMFNNLEVKKDRKIKVGWYIK